MRELTLEQRVARLERIIKIESWHRTDELLGGLIGKANANVKDCEKIANALKADDFLNSNTDIKACEYMFDIDVRFAYKETFYHIKIEDSGDSKSKIKVSLYEYKNNRDRLKDEVEGLRLNASAIIKAVKDLINDVTDYSSRIEKASKCSSREVRRQLDRENREREAQWEREREAMSKKSYDDEKPSKNGYYHNSELSSSKDWYDINPSRAGTEIDGYEYGRL